MYVITHGEEGELDDDTAAKLITKGILLQPNGSVATNPLLCRYFLAGSTIDPTPILEALDIGSGRGLEIGCGYGRLTAVVASRGLTFDAIEPNARLAKQAATRIQAHTRCRVFSAAIESFKSPSAYDWAFCATDCVLALRERSVIKSHLRAMAYNLKPGALYMLRLDIRNQPWSKVEQRTQIDVNDRRLLLTRTNEQYSHLTRQITERIVISDERTGAVLHGEHRALASFDSADSMELLNSISSICLEAIYSEHFQEVQDRDLSDGSYWMLLRARDE